MGWSLQIDLAEAIPLATNRGWGDMLDWVKALPAGQFMGLRHLCQYGWVGPVALAARDLAAALAAQSPADHETRHTADEMLASLKAGGGAEVVSVTDGLGPDDGSEEEGV